MSENEEKQAPDSESWASFIQQGLAFLAITAVFWAPFLAFVAAIFCDGVFGTKIIEAFKNARP